MTTPSETEFDFAALQADWQATGPALAPADQIRDHVRKRGRWIAAWLVGDLIIGVLATAGLTFRLMTATDGWDRLAFGVLAAMTAGFVLFTWWHWRGTRRPSSQTTSEYVTWTLERSLRFARYARAGWLLLAIEALVLVPWVAHQLYGAGRSPSAKHQALVWLFLAMMLGLGAWILRRLQRWTRRDAQVLADIATELERG